MKPSGDGAAIASASATGLGHRKNYSKQRKKDAAEDIKLKIAQRLNVWKSDAYRQCGAIMALRIDTLRVMSYSSLALSLGSVDLLGVSHFCWQSSFDYMPQVFAIEGFRHDWLPDKGQDMGKHGNFEFLEAFYHE